MASKTIKVASEFSRVPAGRLRTDGPYTGERFREELLIPALRNYDEVIIKLDGVVGYGSSFLEEAFGGTIRKKIMSKDEMKRKLKLETSLPSRKQEILQYINDA